MTFAALFAYEVDAGQAGAFEAVYGADGEWARFFRGGDGYLGTELLRAAGSDALRYVVIDRWRSAAAYERFLAGHEDEYARRSRATEHLYRDETAVGTYDVLAAAYHEPRER